MSGRCTLVVNGRSLRIAAGETPLEAALAEGLIAPAQAVHGTAMLGQASGPAARRTNARTARPAAAPLASQAMENGALGPAAEPLPVVRRTGTVTEIERLCPSVVQAVVTLSKPLSYTPGHQVEIAAPGYDPVHVTPSLRVDGSAELNELVFHLGCEGGVIVGTLAGALEEGQPVTVKGPVGNGFYRAGGGRMVLVSDEAGFAGIWAIARAARYIEPAREQALIVGARDPLDLYMGPALEWLRATGVPRITVVADRNRQRPPDVRPGPLTAHVPMLRANDAVYVSGRAATVGAVEVLAASVGSRCYTIPLDPNM